MTGVVSVMYDEANDRKNVGLFVSGKCSGRALTKREEKGVDKGLMLGILICKAEL